MKKLLILGAGSAGTMVANRMNRMLKREEWQITIVDPEAVHYYQPGFLFVPFGMYTEKDCFEPRQKYLPGGVQYIQETVEIIEPDHNKVRLESGKELEYDFLVIATGAHIHPEETPGLAEHEWGRSIHSFYTLESSSALAKTMREFKGGRLVTVRYGQPRSFQLFIARATHKPGEKLAGGEAIMMGLIEAVIDRYAATDELEAAVLLIATDSLPRRVAWKEL